MDLRAFWLGWRRDIRRFVALCGAALVLGLLINRGIAGARHGIARLAPSGLESVLDGVDGIATSGPRTSGEHWTYRERLTPGKSVWVRNLNGSVTVERSRGDSLAVTAVKSFGTSDPRSVRLVTVPGPDGVAICALWEGAQSHCGTGSDYKLGATHENDVAVQITVRLPPGDRVEATTVNGNVRVSGASAPVVAGTVNGDVTAETADGPVNAFCVNGSVHVVIGGFADTGAVKIATVNGAVTVELPARLDATVNAKTVHGSIDSDFPLAVSSTFGVRHAAGAIGAGGRPIVVNAVNGSIRLQKGRRARAP